MIGIKEALSTSETDVIDDTMLNTVLEPARANLVAARLARLRIGPSSIKGSSIDVPHGNKDAMVVSKIAEGAEFPNSIKDYTKRTLSPAKYGLKPMVTNEMIEDSMIDVIRSQFDEVGYKMSQKLDSLCIAALDAGATAAGGNFDQGSQVALGFDNMTTSQFALRNVDYEPDTMLVGPAGLQDLQLTDTFTEVDKFGNREMQEKGYVGRILGMNVYYSSQVTKTDSGALAYIFDKRHAFMIAEKRPISIVRFSDHARDLTNMAVSARWDVKYSRPDACSVITTT